MSRIILCNSVTQVTLVLNCFAVASNAALHFPRVKVDLKAYQMLLIQSGPPHSVMSRGANASKPSMVLVNEHHSLDRIKSKVQVTMETQVSQLCSIISPTVPRPCDVNVLPNSYPRGLVSSHMPTRSRACVKVALRHSLPEFLLVNSKSNNLVKFITERQDLDRMALFRLAS